MTTSAATAHAQELTPHDFAPSPPGREREFVETGHNLVISEAPKIENGRPWTRTQLGELFSSLASTGYLRSTIDGPFEPARLTLAQHASLLEGVASRAPFLSNHSAQRYIAESGTDRAKTMYLSSLLSGSMIGAIAVTEPASGSDARRTQTRLTPNTDGSYLIDGTKTWVTHGLTADLGMVLASDHTGQPRRVIVELDQPGITRTPIASHGLRHLTFASIAFHDAKVEPWNVLDEDGLEGAKKGFATARALVAVQAASIGLSSLYHAVHHLSTRQARGRALTSSEVIRIEIGRMASQLCAARAFAYHAVAAIDDNRPDSSATACAAKSLAARTATETTTRVMQICGGYGFDDLAPFSKYRDDAEMLTTADGTEIINEMVWGKHIIDRILDPR